MSTLQPDAPRGFYVERVIIRGFRGITNVQLELEADLTVLAGRNNAGKSRVMSALQLALGGRSAEVDDFTAGSSTEPEIDIIVAPEPPAGQSDDHEFSAGFTALYEGQIQPLSEDPLRERLGWRTTVSRSAEGLGARSESRFLTYSEGDQTWLASGAATTMSTRQRRAFAVDFVNTGRDLRDELGRQGSNIRRVLADLEVPKEIRTTLELDLAALNSRILSESATLKSVTEELGRLHEIVGSIGEPALNPLPSNLDELSRLVSIDLDTGSGPLPIRLHGAGSRSLSSLQVQGVLYDRRLGKDTSAVSAMPVTLVEEPEAHLHPQASMELPDLLHHLRGQKIVSTHSAHLVTAIEPRAIRLMQVRDNDIHVVDLGPATDSNTATHRAFRPALHTAEMEKIRRLVERPFGELLFASTVILGDGATERGFLPVILRHAIKHRSHGVASVDAGSLNGELAKAIVKFAAMTRMPCIVFADSDNAGVSAVDALRRIAGSYDIAVIWINGVNADGTPKAGAIEDMLLDFDENLCRRACDIVRPGMTGSTKEVLKQAKGSSGRYLAQELIRLYPSTSDWPAPIQELIECVGNES